MNVKHGFSVDLEEWFHILNWDGLLKPDRWTEFDSRIVSNTFRILGLLDQYQVKATFFVVGWVAQHYPELVNEIARHEHEIGCHGHLHRMVSALTPDEFARDLETSLEAILRATGKEAKMYRAPGFSITRDEFWAFKVLASAGIRADSSLFLAPHAHGGLSLKRCKPFKIILPDGRQLMEVPVVPLTLGPWTVPYSGGGYLRLFPARLIELLFQKVEDSGLPSIVYVHPRDFDTNPRRLNLPVLRKLKYHIGEKSIPGKVEQLLRSRPFTTLGQIANTVLPDRSLYLTSLSN